MYGVPILQRIRPGAIHSHLFTFQMDRCRLNQTRRPCSASLPSKPSAFPCGSTPQGCPELMHQPCRSGHRHSKHTVNSVFCVLCCSQMKIQWTVQQARSNARPCTLYHVAMLPCWTFSRRFCSIMKLIRPQFSIAITACKVPFQFQPKVPPINRLVWRRREFCDQCSH
jgi:hypothetical protein